MFSTFGRSNLTLGRRRPYHHFDCRRLNVVETGGVHILALTSKGGRTIRASGLPDGEPLRNAGVETLTVQVASCASKAWRSVTPLCVVSTQTNLLG